jgi:hypothetical protein
MIDSYEAWRIRMGYNNDGGDNDERNDGNSGGSSSSSSSGGELPDIIDYRDYLEMGGLEEDPSVTVYSDVSVMESDVEGDSMSSESDDWAQSFNVFDDDTEPSQLTPEE